MKIKSAAAIFAATMLTVCMAFADGAQIPVNTDEPTLISANEGTVLYINDSADGLKCLADEDGEPMLPLRAMCETLGFNVDWVDETETVIVEKMPVYITFSPHTDGYTFAKTAPMKLGKAPKLVNDTTYVPLNFADEILGATVKSWDGRINLYYGDYLINEAVVKEVGESSLTVYDLKRGEVVANLTAETAVYSAEGLVIKASDLKEGTYIEIEYGELMTASLPPITDAVKINVKDDVGSYDSISGKVCALEADEYGIRVTVGDKDDVNTHTALNISEDTKIITADGKALKAAEIAKLLTADSASKGAEMIEGKTINAVVSMAATFSIPPQRSAFSIFVTAE